MASFSYVLGGGLLRDLRRAPDGSQCIVSLNSTDQTESRLGSGLNGAPRCPILDLDHAGETQSHFRRM